MNLYYFDNAATSFPKPEKVYQKADNSLRNAYGNPGRTGSTQSLASERLIYSARERLSHFLNANDPSRIVFTMSTTDALNMAIKGVLKPGDHVIFTAMEHNSVLRPLGGLCRSGYITSTMVKCCKEGFPDLDHLDSLFNNKTKLVVCNHASNVTGSILPLKDIIEKAHGKGAFVLVDAAQTGGILPIDLESLEIDMLAFAGHKGLLGPPGVGGLYIRRGIELKYWREGGTGSFSELDIHPESMPERLEAGTMNSTGIAALEEGIKHIQETGLEKIRQKEVEMRDCLWKALSRIESIILHGSPRSSMSVGIVSFTMDGVDCGEMGYILENFFGILCRTGLHCAPLAHKAIGTFPSGTVRLSPGLFTSMDELKYLIESISEIATLKVKV